MVMNLMVEYVKKNDMKQTKAGVRKFDTNPKQCLIFYWEIPQNSTNFLHKQKTSKVCSNIADGSESWIRSC